jgi:hypothetical protein
VPLTAAPQSSPEQVELPMPLAAKQERPPQLAPPMPLAATQLPPPQAAVPLPLTATHWEAVQVASPWALTATLSPCAGPVVPMPAGSAAAVAKKMLHATIRPKRAMSFFFKALFCIDFTTVQALVRQF